jgi:hypothetical protein
LAFYQKQRRKSDLIDKTPKAELNPLLIHTASGELRVVTARCPLPSFRQSAVYFSLPGFITLKLFSACVP